AHSSRSWFRARSINARDRRSPRCAADDRPEPEETAMGVMDGVNVLEVAEHGFVPSAAAILAEWGANVVKVERPTGDPLRQIMAMGFVADTGDFNFLFEQF